MKLRSARRPAVIATATVGVFALGFGGTAVAHGLITGAEVKDGSLTGRDIETNSVTYLDIANGTVRTTEITNGTILLRDLSPQTIEALGEGVRQLTAAVNARVLEVEGDITDLQGAHTAIKADVKELQDDLAALKGTVGDLKDSVDSIATGMTALDERVEKLEGSATVSSNWGTQLRNVIGFGSATLRQGPASSAFGPLSTPPAGTGSLQIDVANGASKVSFGNEVDFAGDAPSSLGSPTYKVYTTTENITAGGPTVINVPTLNVELNPNVAGRSYTSLVFTPTKVATPGWNTFDTATDGYWWFSQALVAAATNCGQANSCTLTQALDGLGDDASLFTVGINKGRDSEFHGAVDALTVGNTTYDFEARGVIATAAE